MAITFQIEAYDGTVEYDLLDISTAPELKLIEGSWRVVRAPDGAMIHTMLLVGSTQVKGTMGDFRTGVTGLETILERAVEFHTDPHEADSLWLKWLTDGEGDRRQLIRSYTLLPANEDIIMAHMRAETSYWNLAITCEPFYEDESATAVSSSLSEFGGKWDLSGTTGGVVDARVGEALITTPGGGGTYEKYWLGFRQVRGGITNFDPTLECEAATNLTADTGTFADAGASGGNVMRVRFDNHVGPPAGVNTLEYKFTLPLSHQPNPEEYEGRYKVLLRAKLSAASTEVGIRLSTSWTGTFPASVQNVQSIEYFSSTSWTLLELGEISIPAEKLRQQVRAISAAPTGINLDNFRFNIEAEKLSGAGDLYCDAFILIPAEHVIFVDNAAAGASELTFVWTHENGEIHGFCTDVSYDVNSVVEVTAENWAYPHDGAVAVFAAEKSSGHTITDSPTVALDLYKRWISVKS